jgi:hypothetical protein
VSDQPIRDVLDNANYFQLEARATVGRFEILVGVLMPTGAAKLVAPEANPKNRTIKTQMWRRYSRDMARGFWRLTHQGVAFDSDGALLDGQHRLLAIVNAGLGVPIVIFLNCEPESREAVDLATKRSTFDIVNLAGAAVERNVVQTSMFLAYRFHGENRPTSDTERVAFVRLHEEAIRWAVMAIPPDTPMAEPAIWSVFARAWYGRDREQLGRLATIFATGGMIADPAERDQAANEFRNFRIRAREKNLKVSAPSLYKRTEAVVGDYLDGRLKPARGGRWPEATTELFPIAGETFETKTLKRKKTAPESTTE